MNKKIACLGIVLSAILLWLVLRNIDVRSMIRTIIAINGTYLGLSVLAFLFTIYFRAVRWRFLIPKTPPIEVVTLFSATTIGLMINNILPVRIGEVARAYLIGKKGKVSGITALATLGIERILDVICLLSMLAFYVLVRQGEQLQKTSLQIALFGSLFLTILAGLIGIIYAGFSYRARVQVLIGRGMGSRFPSLSHRVVDLFSKLLAGFTSIRSVKQFVQILTLTLCLWLCAAASYYLLMRSFSFPLGFSSALLVLVMVAFAAAIPSAPGATGTFHVACIVGLSLVGFQNHDSAASFAFTLHASEWISSTILGFLFLWSDGLSLSAVQQQAKTETVPVLLS
jgi:uncharacterized protein (TIRG00374 family)